MNEKIEAGTEIKPIEAKEAIREKHLGGRPKKTLDDLPSDWEVTITNEMRQGASRQEIKAKLNISNDLFARLMREDERFSETIKEAESFSLAWWMEIARKNLENKGFNAVLWYMNMKNRFGWKDRQEIEHKNTDQTAVFDVTQLKPDELVTLSNMLKRIEKQEKPVE